MKREGEMLKNVRFKRLKENRFRIAPMQVLKNHLKLYPRATLKKNKERKKKKKKEKPKQSQRIVLDF